MFLPFRAKKSSALQYHVNGKNPVPMKKKAPENRMTAQ